ncbi:MAG: 2-dehydro-3-deoxy-6-phosphogalactonate aldolase [Candidatus Accumulibacter sp.]|jgi:2-dehydro-3-deoxyphosphogalactonate aldolase|nr:2-dehydro-3-deoxy-6-phosphogalactonate aldolase [Accumulibacter sp.]
MTSTISPPERFAAAVAALPLVAVLRGIRPEESEGIGRALYDAGFRLLEVPLNSPEPFASIARMRKALPDDALVGAGTVMTPGQAAQVAECGGEMVFMPHADLAVVRAAKSLGLSCVPGVLTPTEAFAALAAGADGLKLFPGEMIPPKVVKAIRAVLPKDTLLLPFGGITAETLRPYLEAGAGGFGLGSAIYQPGLRADEVARRARAFVEAWKVVNQRTED